MIKKTILSLALILTINSLYAEVEIIDDSQNYAYNEHPSNQKLQRNIASEQPSVWSEQDVDSNRGSTESAANDSERYQLLMNKLEQMQQEIANLRGQVEVQAHQLKSVGLNNRAEKNNSALSSQTTQSEPKEESVKGQSLSKSADSREAAIDLKQEELQTSQSITEAKPEKVIRKSDDPMDEQLSYVGAFEHVKHKRYNEALTSMQSFLNSYPDGPYAANAHYWLGELYLQKSDFKQALEQFNTIINQFSDSTKLSSALYKLGMTYEQLGDKDKAQAQFRKVTEEFPGTALARLAKSKIS